MMGDIICSYYHWRILAKITLWILVTSNGYELYLIVGQVYLEFYVYYTTPTGMQPHYKLDR